MLFKDYFQHVHSGHIITSGQALPIGCLGTFCRIFRSWVEMHGLSQVAVAPVSYLTQGCPSNNWVEVHWHVNSLDNLASLVPLQQPTKRYLLLLFQALQPIVATLPNRRILSLCSFHVYRLWFCWCCRPEFKKTCITNMGCGSCIHACLPAPTVLMYTDVWNVFHWIMVSCVLLSTLQLGSPLPLSLLSLRIWHTLWMMLGFPHTVVTYDGGLAFLQIGILLPIFGLFCDSTRLTCGHHHVQWSAGVSVCDYSTAYWEKWPIKWFTVTNHFSTICKLCMLWSNFR